MSQPKTDNSGGLVSTIGLTLWVGLALFMLLYLRERGEFQDQLRIERGRRAELEEQARAREEKLDGALDTIHKLTRDEPAGDE